MPSELAVVARAAEAWRRDDLAAIAALNDWQIMSREARELRQQSEQMGRSLAQWLRHLDPPEPRLAALEALTPAPSWPVAFALAGVATGAPVRAIALAFAAGWAEAMVQAALKAVPLGQSAGQRVLAALGEQIPAAVETALAHRTRRRCRPSRRCSPSSPRGTRSSTRACSDPDPDPP